MSSIKRAIFPGTFDPFTVGHESVVLRGLACFDEIIIGIGCHSGKKTFFDIATRLKMIEDVFVDFPEVSVKVFEGLTVDFAKGSGAKFILRGIRTSADFEYERAIAQVNKSMSDIDTFMLLTSPEHTPVTSTIVRDIITHGGDVSSFIPNKIDIRNYLS